MSYGISYGGESALLPEKPVDVSIREVRKQIRIELATNIRSYREVDGRITNKNALYEIACLLKALELLPTR